MKTIKVVYTTRVLSSEELKTKSLKNYYFLCSYNVVKVGDLIVSPMYTTPMMVVEIINSDSTIRNGFNLKNIIIDTINGFSVKDITDQRKTSKEQPIKKQNMEKKSVFAGFIEKYKAQFIPEKDESLKLSMDGKVCALVGDEYVGIDENNELISYPAEMCLDFPIYLIAKPYSQVEVGDIIKINRSYVKVLKKNPNKSFSCLTFSGYTQNKKEVKDFILGQAFVKTVVNMFGNMKTGGFNPMMLALANGEMEAKDLLMMQMFQGGGLSQTNQMNPMLMMALMDKGEDSSMLETMLMMQMMGGQTPALFAPTSENK